MPNTIKNVIVLNDHSYVNGGQAKIAIDTALGLKKAGLNVTFFSPCGPPDSRLFECGVEVVCLHQKDMLTEPNRFRAAAQALWNTKAARELNLLCANFDPSNTLIHCHGFAKALSPSIGPILTKGPLKCVYTMHEYFLACPNGGFFDFQKREICHRKALRLSCLTTNCDVRHPTHKAYRIARQAILWSLGNMPRGLSDIIYISSTELNAMRQYLHPKTRLHYVPNPVTVAKEVLIDASLNDYFIFIGRLNPEKGGLVFAQAAQEAGVKAVFVGDGPQRAEIEAANPTAIITGWQNEKSVHSWLHKARCLVFPSLWYETFGLAVHEALSMGIPVVCGKWSAAADAVAASGKGLLLEDTSVDQLKTAIRRLQDAQRSDPIFKPIKAPTQTTDAYIENILTVYENILLS